jgi:hypothetical protein
LAVDLVDPKANLHVGAKADDDDDSASDASRLELHDWRPHFAFAPGQAPPELDSLAARLRACDAYVCVTPE